MDDLLTLAHDDPDAIHSLVAEIATEMRRMPENLLTPQERKYRSLFSMYAFDKDIRAYSFKDTVEVIGLLSDEALATQHRLDEEALMERNPGASFSIRMPDDAYEYGVEFLRRVAKEVRNSICGARTKTGYAGQRSLTKDAMTAGVASGLAALGITSSMALGVSVLVLLVLARACHKSFCDMTDDEVVAAVKKTASTEQANLKRPT